MVEKPEHEATHHLGEDFRIDFKHELQIAGLRLNCTLSVDGRPVVTIQYVARLPKIEVRGNDSYTYRPTDADLQNSNVAGMTLNNLDDWYRQFVDPTARVALGMHWFIEALDSKNNVLARSETRALILSP